MSKKERVAAEYPPASSSARYHRSSLTPKAGLGSSSTKVQVVGDAYGSERAYDSEAVRHDSGAPQVVAGYHTEGVPSTSKRASKDLYRTTLDRRAHNGRLSSMPAAPPQSFGYPYDNHQQPIPDTDDSAAEQNSSLRRVKKDRERDRDRDRRHRDRDRDQYDRQYDRQHDRSGAIPAEVWMNQVAAPHEPKSSRPAKRESRSTRRQDETPLSTQPELPRTYPQTTSASADHQKHVHSQQPYAYPQQPSSSAPYRPASTTPVLPHQDYHRSSPPAGAPPDNYAALLSPTPENLAQLKPRYEYVIDDRAGLRSPPPVEVPHAFPQNSYEHYNQPESVALQPPRSLAQLKADGVIPSSPGPTHRRTHRPVRSEDVTAGGFFADGTPSGQHGLHAEHARPSIRHRPSRSELGLGQPPNAAPEEPQHDALAQQLPTPGMFGAGLAVTTARGVPAPGGIVMHPQLQESFAESANASRAPVNAAMANAAILGYSTAQPESDSSSAKDREISSHRRKDRRPRRSSKQPEVLSPQAGIVYPEPNRQTQAEAVRHMIIEPSPPPVVVGYPTGRRPRTTSGRSAGQDEEHEPEPDTVVYQTPEPVIIDMGARRVSRSSLSGPRVDLGLNGPRGDALLASRPDMTFAGAGVALGPQRGDGGHEAREVSARRGSVLDDERARRPSGGTEERGRRPSIEKPGRPMDVRKSMESESSLQDYESAVMAGSTAATHDAQDFSSAKDAMSPRSNYYSVAASVRSVINEARGAANEARSIANEVREMGATTVILQSQSGSKAAPPLTQPRQGGVRTSSAPSIINGLPPTISRNTSSKPVTAVPATPLLRSGDVASPPEMHARPRAPSGSLPAPPPMPDAPGLRATVDAHVRDNAHPTMVDEEGRLARPPAASQTMPTRAPRHSLTRQGPPPMGIVTPVASPPNPHAESQASALPKNLQQQQQPAGGSKESLVDQNGKSGKSKSSRWFWPKSKPVEPGSGVRAQTSSPAPPSATSPPPQRVRHPSLLNQLMMGTPNSKSKSAQKAPEHVGPAAPRMSTEFYQSMDSTPSSVTLEVDPEPTKKDESRMPRMFASIKNSLRRTPSSSKIGHHFSRSMSRLPGTREAAAPPPPPGAPLTRSLSAKDSAWPMSPSHAKESLRPTKDGADAPPPPPPVIPPAVPAPLQSTAAPAPPAVAQPPPPAPAPAPAAPVPIPKTQKPSPPEPIPIKDERRMLGKDVPIMDKGRSAPPTSSRAPAPTELTHSKSRASVDGRPVDVNGRPIESSSRTPNPEYISRSTGHRSSVQVAPPPHPRAASPPLVSRPVAATRVPASGQTNIFASAPSRPSNQSNPVPVSSSRGQSRDRSRSSRDPELLSAPAPLRTPRPREAVPVPAAALEPVVPGAELGLPTPEATPRSSPTGGAMFDNNKPAQAPPPAKEKSRPANIVIPKPDLAAVNQKLVFDHRQKRAISIASLEAVTGQEAHFRSEASSIRTVTPGPGQTTFPRQDPLAAAQDWTALQLHEDKLASRHDSITRRLQDEANGKRYRGGLKRTKGSRKPGVAFDFPGPVIDEDGEEKEDPRTLDIQRTYELERMQKRYK
ncbi:mucin-5AC [Ceratobasidium sp. AG-Ba]|nr:mucin-5AC [Ceratobasidium sp. AG-Ba]QRW14695.1 mucin-5AC [Ceratobasidium sp. AG-Ba]